jgi:predicted SAM-dependent methyltransferase
MEHVVEHIHYTDFIKMLEIVKKFLKKGAVIRIAVPDKYHPSEYVRKLVGVQGQEPGAEDHKYFYCIDDFEKNCKTNRV